MSTFNGSSGKASHPYHFPIPPLPEGTSRPFWSVMIPTYNCASFLKETLQSVLAQDPGPEMMQIEVVDDCSNLDDPAAVVEEIGKGRVGFYRQQQNVGHVRNFDTCLQRSCGRIIHLLHGDDAVRPGFYHVMERAFREHAEIGAAYCRNIFMDEASNWLNINPLEQADSGILEGWLEKIGSGQRLQAPAMVVRREVYECLGGFDRRIPHYGEDWEMWVRIAAKYPVWYETEPLALYRTRKASLSSKTLRTGQNARELREVIEINKSYLPEDRRKTITNTARREFALACIRRAHRMVGSEFHTSALIQAGEALKTYPSIRVVAGAAFVSLRWALHRLSRRS